MNAVTRKGQAMHDSLPLLRTGEHAQAVVNLLYRTNPKTPAIRRTVHQASPASISPERASHDPRCGGAGFLNAGKQRPKERFPHMTVRAIVFDIGGVLLRTDSPEPRRRLEEAHGLAPGGAAKLVFDSPMGQAAQRGEVTTATLWHWVQQELKLDEVGMADFYRQFWAGDGLNESLMAFIRRLRPAYKTGIISNATDNLLELITHAYPIADAFDVIVGSAIEQVVKPDPRIYQRCLERLGILPEEAIFIDDFAHNIAGARAVGMAGLLYTRETDVENELQKWGVRV